MRLKDQNLFNRFATFLALAILTVFFPVRSLAAPPALYVSGTSIMRSDTNCAVTLRGVNIPSLEWGVGEGPPSGIGGDIVQSVTYALDTLKANIVRIPLNSGRWIQWPYSYSQTVDDIVAACSVRNCYAILDLHLLSKDGTTQAAMPDNTASTFWNQVAQRYKNNPAVLFGVYNEPFPGDWTTWQNGSGGPGIPALLSQIRGISGGPATNICLIGGLQYAYQLTGMPALTDSTGNYVFDEHIYPSKGASSNWDSNIGSPGKPVFVGEFGQLSADGSTGQWITGTFLPWLAGKNYGATAWGFNANASLTYGMLTGYFTFNAWDGVPVQNWLTGASAGCNPTHPNPIPTPVPTSTPSAGSCFMLDNLEDGNIANATNGLWFTFRWTSVNGAAATPWQATESCPDGTPCPYILDNTQSANGGTYSARVTGGFTVNGPTTYAGFALGTELAPGYTNLNSWMTMVSFDVRSTTAPVTLRCNAVNPKISYAPVVYQGATMAGSGGGTDNQYGFNFVVTQANTWQHVVRTINAFECGDWGPQSCPPPIPRGQTSTFITMAQAMTQITSLQWETQGNPISFGYWVDNVCLSGSPIPPTATPSAVVGTNTFTPTFTRTFTLTPTFSSTFTRTFTNTNTPPINTNTFTPTSTSTFTPTRTSTFTNTNTVANTNTFTNTPTRTFTPTFTNTLTNTSTFTNTVANTSTFTNTPTRTFTPTFTNTAANTNTFTNTFTNTPVNTNTSTSTPTRTFTSTNTLTFTNTVANTSTFTNTSTRTFTPTFTNTAANTNTFTNTFTNTPVNTSTFTPTRTFSPTFTYTATSTSTFTNTSTRTFTNTATNTGTPTNSPTGTQSPTATFTNTGTSTNTPTKTNTPTFTSTYSFTSTLTSTNTSSSTSTSTSTNTSTNTPVFTNSFTPTRTNTPTFTSTSTFTSTNTSTSTNTPTNTGTPTNSPTGTQSPTATFTNTGTSTSTPTKTNTPTFTSTYSFTPTFTSTSTNSFTSTLTPSFTRTPTSTNTFTPSPTNTPTLTSTGVFTATFTPTSVTVAVTTGPSAPPSSTQLPGVTNLPVDQVVLTNPGTVPMTVTQLTLVDTGSANPSSGINQLTLDVNGSPVGTTNFTGATATFTGLTVIIPAGGSVTLQTNADFSNGAPTGTYLFNLNTISASNGQPAQFNGIPLDGAKITIAVATSTPTNSPTFTVTPTSTITPATIQISLGSPAPPSSAQLPGASNVPVILVVLTNTGNTAVNFTSLTVTDNGTGNPLGISGLVLSNNGNPVGSASFSGPSAAFNGLSINIPASGSVTLQVAANFSNGASSGTYQFSVTNGAGNNGQSVIVSGLPSTGATITIGSATPTATVTPTHSQDDKPVIYPNPATGPGPVSIQVTLDQPAASIKVQVFTIAFRSVQDIEIPSPTGMPTTLWNFSLAVVDKWGSPLANGLYYVVVTANGKQTVGKLLVIR